MKALADWHFASRGQSYCDACGEPCAECPYIVNAPQTADGLTAWAVIERCGGQIRVGFGGSYALDFAAILMMADAMGARTTLLADVLPIVEPLIVRAYQAEGEV